jgi:sporulation protein YlmC with PRC-barrel domain
MRQALTEWIGHPVAADDGAAGRIEDFVVDITDWSVRHVVLKLEGLLSERRVLLPASRIEAVEPGPVAARGTRRQIRSRPGVYMSGDGPRRLRRESAETGSWETYWSVLGRDGTRNIQCAIEQAAERGRETTTSWNPDLLSAVGLRGARVVGENGTLGRLEDLGIDLAAPRVRSLIVRTPEADGGQDVTFATKRVLSVGVERSRIRLAVSREQLHAVTAGA